GNWTSSASKSTRGRRWLSRRPASASFALPKRPLIDRQSPRSELLNRGRKYGAPSRNNPLGDEERKMAFKPNYNQQRADRNRAKAQKKQEKLKRLEEETAKRKAAVATSLTPKRVGRTHSDGVHHGQETSSP